MPRIIIESDKIHGFLARKIIKARRMAGLSQAELARRAAIRPETLNRIEKGKTTPDTATISIYAPGGTTNLLTIAQSMTITGSILSYLVDTTTVASWPIGTSYRADIETEIEAGSALAGLGAIAHTAPLSICCGPGSTAPVESTRLCCA